MMVDTIIYWLFGFLLVGAGFLAGFITACWIITR